MIEIKDLHVSVEGKEILKGVNLTIANGTVHALMGPNGSGKSTLSNVLMGHPKYTVTSGSIHFNGVDVTSTAVDERSRLGMFLSFQYPAEIEGLSVSQFLRTMTNIHRTNAEKLSILKFKELLVEKMKLLSINPDFAKRNLNQGFSGGEKKRMEILQLLLANPSFAILDETDSGLDIDALRAVSTGVNAFQNSNTATLIITHYKRILEYIKPDVVSILIDGKIAHTGDGSLVDELEKKGYAWITQDD